LLDEVVNEEVNEVNELARRRDTRSTFIKAKYFMEPLSFREKTGFIAF
jgi:hypothetical protein